MNKITIGMYVYMMRVYNSRSHPLAPIYNNMTVAKFYIYRNLHKGNCFSIRYKSKVIDRQEYFIAYNVTFKVSEILRQKVLLKKQKDVHAYAVAEKYSICNDEYNFNELKQIKYNPYKSSNFLIDNKVVNKAKSIIFKDGKCFLLEK